MQMRQRDAEAVASGALTVTFRRWKRSQVVAGHRYRTAAGMIEVDDVRVVAEASITDADAKRAGYRSAAALRTDVRGDAGSPIYRVRFRAVSGPDPRTVLASDAALTDDEVADITSRLQRLDRASSSGAWTAATLAIIAARPRERAADLAATLGRERDPFKLDVRKLKNLGLTRSLEVGYELSPRGRAYLDRSPG